MMFAELGETLLDRNFLVGKGVVSRPVAHDFWPQRRTFHSQHRELAFWVRGAQSWLKHKVDGEPLEDAVFSDGSFYLLSSDYSISKIKVTNVLAAIRTEDDHEIKTDSH
ncbi:hypothetical protein ACFX1X_020970 [Malus domestica]